MSSGEQRLRRTQSYEAILGVIKAAGILSVALVAPNALRMLRLTGHHKKNTYRNAFRRLQEKGCITITKSERGSFATLTPHGHTQLLHMINTGIARPKTWDGKWRIVIFDIKEYRRRERDLLRRQLQEQGFVRLQNSVWVYPYDTEDLITLIKTNHRFGKRVLYIIAEHVENDRWLRELYELPPN